MATPVFCGRIVMRPYDRPPKSIRRGDSRIARLPRKKSAVILRIAGRRCRGQRKAGRDFRSRAALRAVAKPARKRQSRQGASEGSRVVTQGVLFTGFFAALRLRMTGGNGGFCAGRNSVSLNAENAEILYNFSKEKY